MANLLTTAQAAKIIGVTRRRVQQWIDGGQLRAETFGRAYALKEAEVRAFSVKERPGRGRPKSSIPKG